MVSPPVPRATARPVAAPVLVRDPVAALRDSRAPGGKRETRGHHLTGGAEQRVAHRPADVEGVEQRPVGGKARDPARELPAGHAADVFPPIAEDAQALLDALPEGAHAGR